MRLLMQAAIAAALSIPRGLALVALGALCWLPIVALTGATGAFAQEVVLADSTAVLVPYGSWLDAILSNAQGIAVTAMLGLIAVASRKAPAWAAQIIKTLLTEQMLAHAVAFGINAVRGAVRGQSLSVDVGSHVVAQALTYILGKAPSWLLKFVGGPENLKSMILARLQMDANADAPTVLDAVKVAVGADGRGTAHVVPGTVMPNGDILVGRAHS